LIKTFCDVFIKILLKNYCILESKLIKMEETKEDFIQPLLVKTRRTVEMKNLVLPPPPKRAKVFPQNCLMSELFKDA
jgi:hypothetical protein